MLTLLTPIKTLSAGALLSALLLLLTVLLAIRQPWLGLELAAESDAGGVRIAAVHPDGPAREVPVESTLLSLSAGDGGPLVLRALDLVDEPDVLETYGEMSAFFDRQGEIAAILDRGAVDLMLRDEGGAEFQLRLDPMDQRRVTDLPLEFWVQVFVGHAGFLLGLWVWSLRRKDLSTQLFATVGTSMLIFTSAAAVYSTRELALPGELFRALSAANHGGALLFGVAMIALLLSYPRRLVRPRHLWLLPLVFGIWWLADTLWLLSGPPLGSHLPTMLEMIGIVLCAILQYRATRDDPSARAALRWFGLSIAVGAGAFVLTIIAPNLFGASPTLPQGYAFLFFLLIHAGLALGVARYWLFELDEWAFRILFYLGGMILLVMLDAVFIYAVSIERVPAFALSLVIIAFAYLPFRDALGRRLMGRRATGRPELFRQVMDVALTPPGADQFARWRHLLQDLYSPLRIEVAEQDVAAGLDEDGVALVVPAIGMLPALRLVYSAGGRGLFSSRDSELARELRAMLDHALQSRRAYEQGVAEERARIARDMHDNIGMRLMGALHGRDIVRKDALIREALTELRDIINDVSHDGLSLDEVLADLRVEIAEHLESAGITLEWCRDADDQDAQLLPPRIAHTLRSILREAAGNVIRHSGASRLCIGIRRHAGALVLSIEDDGSGFVPEVVASGNGLANMRARVHSLQGRFDLSSSANGTRLEALVPLAQAGLPR